MRHVRWRFPLVMTAFVAGAVAAGSGQARLTCAGVARRVP